MVPKPQWRRYLRMRSAAVRRSRSWQGRRQTSFGIGTATMAAGDMCGFLDRRMLNDQELPERLEPAVSLGGANITFRAYRARKSSGCDPPPRFNQPRGICAPFFRARRHRFQPTAVCDQLPRVIGHLQC